MSRRRDGQAASRPPERLLVPPVAPYPIRAGVDPVAALGAWRAVYDEWTSQRAAWVASGVWPGGEAQRLLGESAALPDELYRPPANKVTGGDLPGGVEQGGQQT